MSTQPVHLAELDAALPLSLDEGLLSANLSAIREFSHEYAALLQRTTLPDNWRPAQTLDGRGGWRMEAAGEAPSWLGGSAAPHRRALATLRTFHQTDRNVVLPALLAGAELDLLQERLAPYQAVFVLESDPRCVAALLRLRDYSPAIRSLRLIFVPDDEGESFLIRLLRAEEGLLPPVSLIVLPGVEDDRISAIRTTCERVVNAVTVERTDALRVCAATSAALDEAAPRLAVVALTADEPLLELAQSAATGAATIGWTVAPVIGMRSPRTGGVLPAARAAEALRAGLALFVGSPAPLPLPAGCRALRWLPALRDIPPRWDDAICLAGTPTVAEAVRRAWPQLTIQEFTLAGPGAATRPHERVDEVYLVGDLPDGRAEACGIEQPTHRMIWDQLTAAIETAWESRQILHGEGLLRAAERSAGVALEAAEARQHVLDLLTRNLIPAAVTERIHRKLVDGGIAVRVLGRGWGRIGVTAQLSHLSLAAMAELPRPAGAVFVGCPDPLTPGLLSAGALHWPLHLYSPGGVSRDPLLHAVLRAGEHYVAFDTGRALLSSIGVERSDVSRAERRAERTASHLATKETYAVRWKALLDALDR